MTSFFLPKHRGTRHKAISHGGLGGFVEIGLAEFDLKDAEINGTWPKMMKRRPPPIEVGCGNVSVHQRTFQSPIHCIWESASPITPSSVSEVDSLKPVLEKRFDNLMSPPLSRYNARSPLCFYPFLPPTPTTPAGDVSSPPAELAGSLLQPSQGFPQNNPPTTPLRYPTPQRRLTDDSSDSTPGLSFSTCSDDSDNMFSSPKKKAARFAKALESSVSSRSSSVRISITKPMSSMNVEELLRHLPGLSLNVVHHVWLPAMESEFARIRAIMQDAAELKLEAHHQLKHFGEDLMAASTDARRISTTYENALQSAESLLERDTTACYERLATIEKGLEDALTTIDEKKDLIRQKDHVIFGLQQTLEFVVRGLESFIHNHFRCDPRDTPDPRLEAVMHIIADHSSTIDNKNTAGRYVRLTEEAYLQDFAKLRAAETKILQYQELAWGQNKTIKSHSRKLDDYLRRYEHCIETINERDHELLLLVERNDKYEKLVDDYENGMCVSQPTKSLQERLIKQNDDMDRTIKSMRLEHAKKLEDRDAEITNLRQKLGSAREEVLTHKADVKNVITHTQAMLSPVYSPGEMTLGGHTAKERKLLAKETARKTHLPNSVSMTSMPFFTGSRIDLSAALEGDPHSDKEMVSRANKVGPVVPRMVARIERPEWACGIPKKRSFPDLKGTDVSYPDLAPRPRKDSLGTAANIPLPQPRSDSLGIVANYMHTLTSHAPEPSSGHPSPIDMHKDLPNPPETASRSDLYQDASGAYNGGVRYPQNPAMPQNDYYTNMPPQKRVLSTVPEISIASSDSDKAMSSSLSITSTDREVYGKSLDALNLMEFMKEGDLRSPRVCKRQSPRGESENRGYGEDVSEEAVETGVAKAVRVGAVAAMNRAASRSGQNNGVVEAKESPPKSVSEMYHFRQRNW